MNKRLKHALFTLAVFGSTLYLCGCSDSLETMLDDYNGNFKTATVQTSYTINDVNPKDMLRPYYAVSFVTTLCLTAPSGGVNYTWTAEVCENANNIVEGTEYVLGSGRVLDLYLRTSALKRWGTYKLTLTITTGSGEILKDTANLYVY